MLRQTDTSIWTIDSVTAQNRGYYSCVVVSSAGNHTALTYLDSREPPPHITAARNQSVILRETAYLHCRTQSNEEPRILWERHGVIVGNSAKVVSFFIDSIVSLLKVSINNTIYSINIPMEHSEFWMQLVEIPVSICVVLQLQVAQTKPMSF